MKDKIHLLLTPRQYPGLVGQMRCRHEGHSQYTLPFDVVFGGEEVSVCSKTGGTVNGQA